MEYNIPIGATKVTIEEPKFYVPPTQENLPPEVSIGNSIETTESRILLKASAKDPDIGGSIASVLWTGSGVIETPNQIETYVNSLYPGNYKFTFTATDNKGAKTSKTIDVKINAVAPPPVNKPVGFGASAKGGEGRELVKVSSLAELNAALRSNRIIQFIKSGVWDGRVILANIQNVTIDANGFDVTFRSPSQGDTVSFTGTNCHHNVLSGIRTINSSNDGINVIEGAHDIYITNCSAYDNNDGNIDLAKGYNISLVRTIIGRINKNAPDPGGGTLITAKECSLWMNLYACFARNPFVHASYTPVGSPNCDAGNNIVLNWTDYGSSVGYNATMNFRNNWSKSNSNASRVLDNQGGYNSEPKGFVFASGNYGIDANKESNHAEFPVPEWARLPLIDGKEAAKEILKVVGPAVRNEYEKSLIAAVVL